MNFCDRLSGLFWIALSIFVCVKSMQVDIGTFGSPGPGFLPFWAAVVFGVLAILLVVKSLLIKKREIKTTTLWREVKWRKALLVLTSLYLYAILLQKIGYLIMTFGLMLLLFGIIGGSKWWIRIASALVTVFATYVIFCVWLGVQLPKGILDF